MHAQPLQDTIPQPDPPLANPALVKEIPAPPPRFLVNVVSSNIAADNSRWTPNMYSLRVVHRTAMQNRVAQQVALNVFMLVVAGGAGFQALSKDDLSGVEADNVQDEQRIRTPLTLLLPVLQSRANEWLSKTEPADAPPFEKPLVVGSHSWRLIYDSLASTDDSYRLTFDAGIYKELDNFSFLNGTRRAGGGCKWASEPRKLEEWKANDYQAVADLAPQAAAKCAGEFAAQLPSLLKGR
ncbi:MAG: hypothetical protein EOO28_30490 [Comamonadaceae bacterium]|nr:MAG: hypothetical protein EOO28_30490 [Comamonadaceae bacterium]